MFEERKRHTIHHQNENSHNCTMFMFCLHDRLNASRFCLCLACLASAHVDVAPSLSLFAGVVVVPYPPFAAGTKYRMQQREKTPKASEGHKNTGGTCSVKKPWIMFDHSSEARLGY